MSFRISELDPVQDAPPRDTLIETSVPVDGTIPMSGIFPGGSDGDGGIELPPLIMYETHSVKLTEAVPCRYYAKGRYTVDSVSETATLKISIPQDYLSACAATSINYVLGGTFDVRLVGRDSNTYEGDTSALFCINASFMLNPNGYNYVNYCTTSGNQSAGYEPLPSGGTLSGAFSGTTLIPNFIQNSSQGDGAVEIGFTILNNTGAYAPTSVEINAVIDFMIHGYNAV
jgi:hypothetical protein